MGIWKLRVWVMALGAVLLSTLTGCASVTQGMTQPIKIDTVAQQGEKLDGANCTLANERETVSATSGQATTVRRWSGNLKIRCTLAGQPPAVGQAISRGNAGVFGNILIGGVVGAAVDLGTGAAYTYPTWVQLVFGEERLYDRSGHRDDSLVVGTLVRPVGARPPVAANTRPGSVPPPASAVVAPVSAPAHVVVASIPPPASAVIASVPPPAVAVEKPGTLPPRRIGKDAYIVEKLAQASSCGAPTASMIDKGPGYESYSVSCADSRPMAVRCEFGNCRVTTQ